MLRIGEVSKRYNISNRTLRHWEEKGIVVSQRLENGYRYFTDESVQRIQQIIALRALRLSITDIESIVGSEAKGEVSKVLQKHLESLTRETEQTAIIKSLLQNLLHSLEREDSLQALLSSFEQETGQLVISQQSKLTTTHKERTLNMQTENSKNLRMVRIPPLTVATYTALSENPEADCSAVMNAFVLENYLHKTIGFRHFGFNNPSPSEDTPEYGYEIQVVIPADFPVPAPLVKKEIEGGLYASIPAHISEIGERWQQLGELCAASESFVLETNQRQWMEECVDFEAFIAPENKDIQLDLLAPIHMK